MLGLDVYRVLEAEKQVFERELVRRQRFQEAMKAEAGATGKMGGGISKLAASIRNLLRSCPATEQATATV